MLVLFLLGLLCFSKIEADEDRCMEKPSCIIPLVYDGTSSKIDVSAQLMWQNKLSGFSKFQVNCGSSYSQIDKVLSSQLGMKFHPAIYGTTGFPDGSKRVYPLTIGEFAFGKRRYKGLFKVANQEGANLLGLDIIMQIGGLDFVDMTMYCRSNIGYRNDLFPAFNVVSNGLKSDPGEIWTLDEIYTKKLDAMNFELQKENVDWGKFNRISSIMSSSINGDKDGIPLGISGNLNDTEINSRFKIIRNIMLGLNIGTS